MARIFGRPLRRNLQRRRLGGVCAGIADFFGIDVTLVRLTFIVSMFVSFSLTFWIYLALWIFIPAKHQVAIPNVTPALKRALRRMDKLVRKMHRHSEFSVADQAQDTFDAIKILSARFDQNRYGRTPGNSQPGDEARLIWQQGTQQFLDIAEQLVVLPKEYEYIRRNGKTPYQKLVSDLNHLHDSLIQASAEILTERPTTSESTVDDHSSRLQAWKKRYIPIKQRLSTRVDQAVMDILARIEEKLQWLLGQESTSDFFDLKPFEVQKIAFEYLPDTMQEYLRLPSTLAKTTRLNNGKTAQESLQEQLIMLDNALDKLSQSLFAKDAHGLLVHGRFLKEKFTDHPFRLAD